MVPIESKHKLAGVKTEVRQLEEKRDPNKPLEFKRPHLSAVKKQFSQ
jgi:hypothetical protein